MSITRMTVWTGLGPLLLQLAYVRSSMQHQVFGQPGVGQRWSTYANAPIATPSGKRPVPGPPIRYVDSGRFDDGTINFKGVWNRAK